MSNEFTKGKHVFRLILLTTERHLLRKSHFQAPMSFSIFFGSPLFVASQEWSVTPGEVAGLHSDDVWGSGSWKWTGRQDWLCISSWWISWLPLFSQLWASAEASILMAQFIFLSLSLQLSVWKATWMFKVAKALQRKNKKSPSSNEARLLGVSYPGSKCRCQRRVQNEFQQWQHCWNKWHLAMVT